MYYIWTCQLLQFFIYSTFKTKQKKSIIGLQKPLKEVILPEAFDSNSLNDEVQVDGSIIQPLSDTCLRRKLISWGFHFQHLSMRKSQVYICLLTRIFV
jgi:hypothetical protein